MTTIDDDSRDHIRAADARADDGFAALGIRQATLRALEDLGYEEPTPIQRETIPLLIAGNDLLGQAATGTGCAGSRAHARAGGSGERSDLQVRPSPWRQGGADLRGPADPSTVAAAR